MNARRVWACASVASALLAAVPHPSAAQALLSREDAVTAAGLRFEGMGSIPRATIARVLSDTTTLNWYRDALLGRTPWPAGADSAYVLYYLVLSDRTEYVPAFLRSAWVSAGRPPNTYILAVSGLARNAAQPAARERLLELIADTTPADYRLHVAIALANANDAPAREILRLVPTAQLPEPVRQMVSDSLAARGRTRNP